jgi:hypothetical protein
VSFELQCPGCPFRYSRQTNLDKHMASVHETTRQEANEVIESVTSSVRDDLGHPERDFFNKVAKTEREQSKLKKLPADARPCAAGCGFFVREKRVTYGEGSRQTTYDVLVHTGFRPEDYPKIERCKSL